MRVYVCVCVCAGYVMDSVDLVLRHELPAELEAHLQRVGRCIWRANSTPSVLGLGWRLDAGAP